MLWMIRRMYVLMKSGYSSSGGAVQVDGRIEVGDQIVQVNRSSFENLSDAQAVDLLRKAAASKKFVS